MALFLLFFFFLPLQLTAQNPPEPTEYRESGAPAESWPAHAVRAPKAMVVSDNPLACRAGIEILRKGGNAVDAAVAVAFALAVVEPRAGNIGGGGFMLVRMAGGATGFVDYREEAPKKAAREMYLNSDGLPDPEGTTVGYRAAGVPGTVAGLALALRTYGTMKLAEVMAPAIRLAERGFPVSEKLAASLEEARARLQRFSNSRRIFLHDGVLYRPAEILRQPELAATLRRIARRGPEEFYRGQTAEELASEMARMGGLISMEDLARYRAKLREPLRASYTARGSQWEVITSPPPSSGGIAIIEALNILAPVQLKGWDGADSVHWVAEAMRRVFADRATYLADADFVRVPVRGLTDPKYAAERRATIDPQRASSSKEIGAGNPAPFDAPQNRQAGGGALSQDEAGAWMLREDTRSGHTTHFSIVDASGNAVANTYTLNDSYGSGVTAPGGFLLNDEMDDFTAYPGRPNMFGLMQSEGNTIAPGKRPLSSMVPTIVLRDGKLSFVTGSPGGPRIISAVLLSVLNWMRLDMDAQADINAPRFHHQWIPDTLWIEDTLPCATAEQLAARGYALLRRGWIGQVEAIGIDPHTGERMGAADGRRQGTAMGY